MITLLKCLKHLKANGPIDKSSGICGNMLLVAEKLGVGTAMPLARELDRLLPKWPETNGRCHMSKTSYPVEGWSSAFFASAQSMTLWQNPRRIVLLDWLIKELEDG